MFVRDSSSSPWQVKEFSLFVEYLSDLWPTDQCWFTTATRKCRGKINMIKEVQFSKRVCGELTLYIRQTSESHDVEVSETMVIHWQPSSIAKTLLLQQKPIILTLNHSQFIQNKPKYSLRNWSKLYGKIDQLFFTFNPFFDIQPYEIRVN